MHEPHKNFKDINSGRNQDFQIIQCVNIELKYIKLGKTQL